jgi:hypothetical protein
MAADDTELDFNTDDFNFSDLGEENDKYLKPVFNSRPIRIAYENAQSIAKKIRLRKGEQIHAIVKGSFIFGDLVESLLVDKKRQCQALHISTLGMSQDNVDSLAGLLKQDYVQNLTIMVSNYFYSHERQKLIPYILKNLDHGGKLDLLVTRNHTKIILMAVDDMRLVFTGSANLRSSNNIEQFSIQESEELYQFYLDFFQDHALYSIIKRED